MAFYAYRCTFDRCTHANFDLPMPMGTAKPTVRCPDGHLARRVYGDVQIAPSALETKGESVRTKIATENDWHKDHPAYRRMRRRGLQPKHVDGAARLEDTVGDQTDITYGHLYGEDGGKPRVQEVLDEHKILVAEGKTGLDTLTGTGGDDE